MNVNDVRPGRYAMRGDVVDVVNVHPGKTTRSARVEYVLREKVRPAGQLAVGERNAIGIVMFAQWATPIGRRRPVGERAGRPYSPRMATKKTSAKATAAKKPLQPSWEKWRKA